MAKLLLLYDLKVRLHLNQTMNPKNFDYKNLFNKVRLVMIEHDPMGLEPGKIDGTPRDEYDMEAAKIVAFLIHNLEDIKINNQLLIDEISNIWQENFEEKCKNVDQMARDIIKRAF